MSAPGTDGPGRVGFGEAGGPVSNPALLHKGLQAR